MSADFKVGDIVRVSFEGKVTRVLPFDGVLELRVEPQEGAFQYVTTDAVNVEKVEPEYEQFGPGDIVRNRAAGLVYAIGFDGWFALSRGRFHSWGDGVDRDYFTSERYERVKVS